MSYDPYVQRLDFSDLIDALNRVGSGVGPEFQELITGMESAGEVMVSAIVPHTPVGVSGELRASIGASQPVVHNGSVEVSVGTPLVYGWPVERGRMPGKAPMVRDSDGKLRAVPALELWVRRVLGVGETDVESVAFAIARAIGKRGTKGAAMFALGFEDARGPVEKILFEAIDNMIDRIIGVK